MIDDMTDKKCFIIMPVTTPKQLVLTYNDPDHFLHVMKCLFKPAVEEAGFKPILPIRRFRNDSRSYYFQS